MFLGELDGKRGVEKSTCVHVQILQEETNTIKSLKV